MVGLDRHPVGCLDDRHLGVAAEEGNQQALVVGIEVLDDHEGGPAVGLQERQQGLERADAAGRRADADDGNGPAAARVVLPFLVGALLVGALIGCRHAAASSCGCR